MPTFDELNEMEWRQRQRQRQPQKSNWFNDQNNNFARASQFLVHFFAFPAQLRREMAKF